MAKFNIKFEISAVYSKDTLWIINILNYVNSFKVIMPEKKYTHTILEKKIT